MGGTTWDTNMFNMIIIIYLVLHGMFFKEISMRLGIHCSTLKTWIELFISSLR
jgi:transposase